MPVAVGDVYLMSIRGQIYGQRVLLTQYYGVAAAPGGVSEIAASTDFLDTVRAGVGGADLLESKYLACMPPEYILERFRVQIVRPIRLAYREVLRGTGGTHANSTEATNQHVSLSMKTDFAGRKFISTKKLGPIPQGVNVQDNGEIAAPYKLLVEQFGGALAAPVVSVVHTIVFQPIIAHPGGVADVTPITQFTINEALRVNRRRTVRVGE